MTLWKKTVVVWGFRKQDVERASQFAVAAARNAGDIFPGHKQCQAYGLPASKINRPEQDKDFDPCVLDLRRARRRNTHTY
ncbi:MAG TPA: hypothetical protein VMP11_10615 [Verrucomicrobiae bacterium]|nr:hypothetical protein [Verrucomicrobiae bacterium]